jgi:LmbE family N-acetylglucosaminyl deacetylase
MQDRKSVARSVGVIVAHPDDETLWSGGLILAHPDWAWTIVTLSRANDPDRAPRFFRVLQYLGAAGAMGDLDDGPEQLPLDQSLIQDTILSLLPTAHFDLIVTHGPRGEYTRHRRHEETCRAVIELWQDGRLSADGVWLFAYEDGGRAYPPRADAAAGTALELPAHVWQDKYRLITRIYGFAPESWEAQATPRQEAFWRFTSPASAQAWLRTRSVDP